MYLHMNMYTCAHRRASLCVCVCLCVCMVCVCVCVQVCVYMNTYVVTRTQWDSSSSIFYKLNVLHSTHNVNTTWVIDEELPQLQIPLAIGK